MTVRADHKVRLKAKQRDMLALIERLGPVSMRALSPHIYGDDRARHVQQVHARSYSLAALGLIKPASTGEREHGKRGIRPLLWVRTEVKA